MKTIKTILDRKENLVTIQKHNRDPVQEEEPNKNLITATSLAWKEEHDRILQTLAGNFDTKIQAVEEGFARLQKAQREAAHGLRGDITKLSGSIHKLRSGVNTMKDEIRSLQQVKVEYSLEGPQPNQVN